MIGRSLKPSRVELRAQRADAAVHHVARGHDIRARACVRGGGAGEQLERCVVVHAAVVEHDAAVAVAGVGAQAHVGDHDQLRVRLLERSNRELDDALVVVGARALLVLLGRQAEQQHGGDAELVRLSGVLHGLGDRQPVHARHGGDRGAALAQLDEHRVNEAVRAELRLAHHAAQHARLAQAAQACGGEGHRLVSLGVCWRSAAGLTASATRRSAAGQDDSAPQTPPPAPPGAAAPRPGRPRRSAPRPRHPASA